MKVFVFFISNSENIYITDQVFIGRVNETEVNIINWGSSSFQRLSCYYLDPYSFIPDI
jgi:hypothetical protein